MKRLHCIGLALATALSFSTLAHGEATAGADTGFHCPHHNNEAADGSAACPHKGRRGHGGRHGEGYLQNRMEALNLSDSQRQELATLFRMYQPRFVELRQRGAAARRQLLDTPPGSAAYSALVDEVAANAARSASETVVLLAELQNNAYALLTPEQQLQWQSMKQQMRERAGQYEGKRHRHGHKGPAASPADSTAQ